MEPLTRLYRKEIGRQKLIYIFFACFFTASFFYAFLISTPQMEEMLNINMGMVGRKNFPEFRNKMLYQPLLHGASRSGMIRSKVNAAVLMSMIFVLLTAFINYLTAFMRWGCEIFELSAVIRTVMKYLLSGIYMAVITLGIIALCIYTRSTWKTIFFVVVYLLVDQFAYGVDIAFLQKIWVGYYLNRWTFTYEYQKVPPGELLIGISVMALYGIAFFRLSLIRTQKIDF